MTLYYTTSAGENEEQLLIQASLGGYKSSTAFKDSDFDNAFGEISTLTLKQNREQYIALMLVNETGSNVENVQMWFEKPEGSVCDFQVAAVDPVLKDGVYQMERTREIYSKPIYANFVDADVDNKASLGNIEAGGYVGIWLKRSLNESAFNESDFYEEDLSRKPFYKEKEKETEEKILLNISWD